MYMLLQLQQVGTLSQLLQLLVYVATPEVRNTKPSWS